eukprot:m.82685 g.82685  ORF g.82685 m.82685 type:complete len:111 (+) comp12884_c1_seq2:334-666(+)
MGSCLSCCCAPKFPTDWGFKPEIIRGYRVPSFADNYKGNDTQVSDEEFLESLILAVGTISDNGGCRKSIEHNIVQKFSIVSKEGDITIEASNLFTFLSLIDDYNMSSQTL